MWECWVSLKLKPEEFSLEPALCVKCLEMTLLWFGAIQIKIDWLMVVYSNYGSPIKSEEVPLGYRNYCSSSTTKQPNFVKLLKCSWIGNLVICVVLFVCLNHVCCWYMIKSHNGLFYFENWPDALWCFFIWLPVLLDLLCWVWHNFELSSVKNRRVLACIYSAAEQRHASEMYCTEWDHNHTLKNLSNNLSNRYYGMNDHLWACLAQIYAITTIYK